MEVSVRTQFLLKLGWGILEKTNSTNKFKIRSWLLVSGTSKVVRVRVAPAIVMALAHGGGDRTRTLLDKGSCRCRRQRRNKVPSHPPSESMRLSKLTLPSLLRKLQLEGVDWNSYHGIFDGNGLSKATFYPLKIQFVSQKCRIRF